MAYALCPDDGPPRLWRFVAPGSLGYEGGYPIVSILDKKQNLLKIDKELFDQLPELTRHAVLRTHDTFEVARA